jgi:hypothetical protein
MAAEDPATPADRDTILRAARFGWTLAEARGRVAELAAGMYREPRRVTEVLPLGTERSSKEQLFEYFDVLGALAEELALDVPLPRFGRSNRASRVFNRAASAVASGSHGADDPERERLNQRLADVCYAWDAQIQDTLGSRPSMSAAYQLARAVAEIRWSLDVPLRKDRKPDEPLPIRFLLGADRGMGIERLLDRLSTYYDPITRNALLKSLAEWRGADVPTPTPRVSPWRDKLTAQATIWHDLVLGQRDGESLVSPGDVMDHPLSLLRVARRLWPETLLVATGTGVLLLAAYWLATPGVAERFGAVAAVVGVTGVTAGGLAARARTQATDLLGALRRDLYRDLVAKKAIVLPPTKPSERTMPKNGSSSTDDEPPPPATNGEVV